MKIADHKFCSSGHGQPPLPACLAAMLLCASPVAVGAAQNAEPADNAAESRHAASQSHMSETLRAEFRHIIVLPGQSPAEQGVSGTYEKDTAGLFGGMDAGSRAVTIEKDIGPIPVNIPIPVLQWPAAIIGGIAGASQREIQEFRDALTEELTTAASQPLTNDKLALDVFWGIRKMPDLDSKLFAPTTEIPADAEAVLYVSLDELAINVQKHEAIITTVASATLRRLGDGQDVYRARISYQDRDTLSNWTENDNALWRDYANFARHYLGRRIAAEVYDRVTVQHQLQPARTGSVSFIKKNAWQGSSQSTTPTLAWDSMLTGSETQGHFAYGIAEADIRYDLEVYDLHQLVYDQAQLQGTEHRIDLELEPCKTYWWSVRPSYHAGNDMRFGEWMHEPPAADSEAGATAPQAPGIIGRQASAAPAYIQDFATLDIKCGRR